MSLKGIPYRCAYALWSSLPGSLQAALRRRQFKNRLRDALASLADRDDIYNRSYYGYVDRMAMLSAAALVDLVMDEFSPASAIDVGCGTGAFLAQLRERGLQVAGLELSEAAIRICHERGLNVLRFDLEGAALLPALSRSEVVICTEVAEHVKPQFANRLVDLLTSLSDRVVFTAAIPGQGGGVDHVNEQPNEYWIERFAQRGLVYLAEKTASGRQRLRDRGAAGFYADNLMLFSRAK